MFIFKMGSLFSKLQINNSYPVFAQLNWAEFSNSALCGYENHSIILLYYLVIYLIRMKYSLICTDVLEIYIFSLKIYYKHNYAKISKVICGPIVPFIYELNIALH